MNPYAPPPNPVGYGVISRYEPLGWKTTVSTIGIVGMVVLPTISSVLTLALGDALKNPVPENFAVILMSGALGLVQIAVCIVTYVVFLLWMHQAAKNVRVFGQQALTITPGWAVGWWFIPLASIWMPFVAMREIWKASDPDSVGPNAKHSWMTSPVPVMLGIWWGTYILNGLLAMGVALATIDLSGRAPVQHPPGVATFLSHGFVAIAGVLVILILRKIAERQETAWARLSSSSGSEPVAPQVLSDNPYLASS